MNSEGLKYLQILKQEIEKIFLNEFPDCNLKITEWRQQEIKKFRELLLERAKGQISEKWFYTHIRTEKNEKLPRTDTLDLLSVFAGYESWADFVKKNSFNEEINISEKKDEVSFFNKIEKNRVWIIAVIAVFAVIFTVFGNFTGGEDENYSFCFFDEDTGKEIVNEKIQIKIYHKNESPEIMTCDSGGCFAFSTKEKNVKFSVDAPYYKKDTFERTLKRKSERINLKTDDYSLMIHYFSTSKIDDWEDRRNTLNKIIHPEAKIIQVDENKRGLEIYNKEEFVNKMTIPLNSLKNIEIINTEYKDEKIINMRFIKKTQ